MKKIIFIILLCYNTYGGSVDSFALGYVSNTFTYGLFHKGLGFNNNSSIICASLTTGTLWFIVESLKDQHNWDNAFPLATGMGLSGITISLWDF